MQGRAEPSNSGLGSTSWDPQLGANIPSSTQNIPSSNPLPFQADFCLNSGFTPGTEQKFQPRVWISPV